MRKRIVSAGVLLAAALVVAGCSTAGPGGGSTSAGDSGEGWLDDMEPVTIALTDINPEASVPGRAFTAFMNEVQTKTKGKIQFDKYWSASLVPQVEMLSAMSSGVIGMTQLTANSFPNELPVTSLMLQLGWMPSDSFPLGTLQGAAAAQEMVASSPEIQDEFDKNNIHSLATAYPYLEYDLICTKPAETLQQTAGLRVRSPGSPWNKELEALGMIPVSMPWADVYDALQRGVIDCAAIMPAADLDSGLVNIAKEFTPVALSGFLGMELSINLDIWNSLPVQAQQIMSDAAVLWWQEYERGSLERYADLATDGVSKYNVVFHDPTQLDKVVTAAQKQNVADLGKTKVAGVEDTTAFIDRYQNLLDKWYGILTTDLGIKDVPRSADSIRETWTTGRGFEIWPIVDRVKQDAFDPYRPE